MPLARSLRAKEELLADVSWARSLAQRLMSDPADVDDVLQDALLAAIQKPASEVDNWRSWLWTTMRNLMNKRLGERGRRGRAISEEDLQRIVDEGVRDPGHALDLEHAKREVLDAVDALGEPRRSVLLSVAREVPQKKIAADLGLHEGTVRTHLFRARQAIRDRFERDREEWAPFAVSTLLLAALRRPGAPLAPVPRAWSRTPTVGLGAIACGVVAVVATLPRSTELVPSPSDSVAAEPTAAESEPRRLREPTPDRELDRPILVSDAEELGLVRGRVFEDARNDAVPRGLAGVSLELELFSRASDSGPVLARGTLDTDGEGRFEWPVPAASSDGVRTLRIRPRHADFLFRSEREGIRPSPLCEWTLPSSSSEGGPIEILAHPLDREIEIDARDEGGVGLPGFRSLLNGVEGRAGADGVHRIRASSTVGESTLYVEAPGYALWKDSYGAALPPRVEPRLKVGGTLEGRIVDATGRAVAGVELRMLEAPGIRTTSGVDGSFELAGLDPDAPSVGLELRTGEGGVPWTELVDDPGRRAVTLTVPSAPLDVRGRVVDDRGQPVAGARVAARFDGRLVYESSDVDGAFRLQGTQLPTDRWPLVVELPGFAPSVHHLEVFAGMIPSAQGVEVVLAPGRDLDLRVVDDVDGSALPGVHARPTLAGISLRHSAGQTDGTGWLTMPGLGDLRDADEVRVTFLAATHGLRSPVPLDELARAPGGLVEMRAHLPIHGVLYSAPGVPYEGELRLLLTDPEGGRVPDLAQTWSEGYVHRSDSDGRWSTAPLLPGGEELRILVEVEGRRAPDPIPHTIGTDPVIATLPPR